MRTHAPSRQIQAVLAISLSLGVLLCVGYLTFYASSTSRSESPFAEGYAAARSGDWRHTADLARQRLKALPKDPDALLLLARASVQLGREETAIGIYGQVAGERLQGTDRAWLASKLVERGNKPGAIEMLKPGVGTDIEAPEQLHLLGKLQVEADQLAEAAPVAKRLAAYPGWEARGWLLLGEIQQAISDPVAAAEAYGKALETDLAGVSIARKDLVLKRVRMLMRAGSFEEAEQAILRLDSQAMEKTSSATGETAWLLSRIFLNQGDRTRAIELLASSEGYRADPLDQEPAPYAGSAACAECHSQIHESQQSSHHAFTFLAGSALAKFPGTATPVADPVDSLVSYQVESGTSPLTITVERDGRSDAATGEFGFGSGDRGMTVVGHDSAGKLREFRVSFYADKPGWDLTTGHPQIPKEARGEPENPSHYLGEILKDDEVRLCFQCHTTNARAARQRIAPTVADRGIGCETCHGPSSTHIRAMKAAPAFTDLAIARPRLASGEATVKLCGRCHSPGGLEVSAKDPTAVRFQATTLTWSRCYQRSQGEFSCITCHNPHRDAVSDAQFYEQKCLECHSGTGPVPTQDSTRDGTRAIDLAAGVPRKICPVNPTSSCVECHMPEIKDALPHTKFTDHFIRVHPREKSGQPSH